MVVVALVGIASGLAGAWWAWGADQSGFAVALAIPLVGSLGGAAAGGAVAAASKADPAHRRGTQMSRNIGAGLKRSYASILTEPLPEELTLLVSQLDKSTPRPA